MASGWLQRHGSTGLVSLVGLVVAGYILSQAQNIESARRLLGLQRKPDSGLTPRNETHGSNSPLITGGTFRARGDQFIGGEHEHHTHLPPAKKPDLPESHAPHNLPDRITSSERFVGREEELKRMADLLAPEGSRVYLNGMGGVGKSELALQHAYGALDHYRGGIVFLDARQGLAAMASQLVKFFRGAFPGVALPEDKSPTELLPLCWSRWPAEAQPPEPVLLILDDQLGANLENDQADKWGYAAERQLFEGLPPRFRRLISQREPGPTGAKAIDLALLQREASLKLLVLQAGEGGPTRLEAEPQAAEDLCAEVGDLPLALVLLGARLAERPDLHLCKLLQDLRGMGAEAKSLLQAHPELGAPRGVVEALMISWEPLSAEAKSLGVLLGVMAPAVIPWELVESCRMPEQRIEEGSAFGDQQVELRRAQLLDRIGDGLYRLHPLVRQFILLQNRDAGELQGRWRKQLVAAVVHECREKLAEIFTKGNVQALNSWLLPHIRQVAEKFTGDLSEDDLIIPFFALEKKFTHDAAFDESIKWLQLGLEQNEQRNGPEHHNNAIILANLGALKAGTNSLMEAEPLLRRALAICEANPAQDELTLGIILRSLSEFLVAFNHMAEAEPLIRRALEIHENNLGADNNQVAADLHSLAGLLQASARLEEAEPLMRRALAIDEENFGSNHPAVARHLTRLASLLKNMNRLEEAESLMRRALEIFEHNYDSNHYEVSDSLIGLVDLLLETDRLAEIEPLISQAFQINLATFGPDHHRVAEVLDRLSRILFRMGNHEQAEESCRRALSIFESSYGCGHPRVAESLYQLAIIMQAKKHWLDAETLVRRALSICEVSYGSNHPKMALLLSELAWILKATDRKEEAEQLLRRALAIDEKTLGPDHYKVSNDLNRLGLLLRDSDRFLEAESLIRRALAIDEASFGSYSPKVVQSLLSLAWLYRSTSRLVDAEPLMRRGIEILIASEAPELHGRFFRNLLRTYLEVLHNLGFSMFRIYGVFNSFPSTLSKTPVMRIKMLAMLFVASLYYKVSKIISGQKKLCKPRKPHLI